MKDTFKRLFEKASYRLSKLKKSLALHYQKFCASDTPTRLLYVFVAASGLGAIAALAYLIYLFLGQIISLATVALGLYILKWLDMPVSAHPTVNVASDRETVYAVLWETVRETATILNLETPATLQSLLIQGRPMSDDLPRFWARVRKKDGLDTGALPPEEVHNILHTELTRVCQLHAHEFLSGLSGLYLDVCNDRGFYLELAIMPIIPQTQGYVYKKEQMRLSRQSAGQQTEAPPDGLF